MSHKVMAPGEFRIGVALYGRNVWHDLVPVCAPGCCCVRHQPPDDPWHWNAETQLQWQVRRG